MMRATLIAATCLFAVAAHAETVKFMGQMNAGSEVPPKDSKGTGVANATLDTTTKKLTYSVSWKDLTGPATAAHFHAPADPGANAPVAVSFGNNPTSPVNGSATLTDAQMQQLMAGKFYANVHTAKNPGGEIRGQMMKQ